MTTDLARLLEQAVPEPDRFLDPRRVLEAARHRRRVQSFTWPLAALALMTAVGAPLLFANSERPAQVATRMPGLDPVVDMDLVGISKASGGFGDQHEFLVTQTYRVSTLRAGDMITMVGVVGPGLSSATSSISDATFGHPEVGSLGATVYCSASLTGDARGSDYRARVRRIDTYGRSTTYDAPLDRVSAESWRAQVAQYCLVFPFNTLPLAVVSAAAVPGTHDLDVVVRLTNPTQHALSVSSTPTLRWNGLKISGFPLDSTLPAGGTSLSRYSIRGGECVGGGGESSGLGGPAPGPYRLDLPVVVSDKAGRVPGNWSGLSTLDPASEAVIGNQFAALCPTTP